jgi:hypothetical protein
MNHPQQRDVFRPGLLAGRTAFLAGATSGINLAIAHRCVELGAPAARVVLQLIGWSSSGSAAAR